MASPWRSAGRSAAPACSRRSRSSLGGGALLLRPVLPALRPLRAGAICLFAAVTLALAAGTLGVSSGPGRGAQAWTLGPPAERTAASPARRSTRSTHRLVQDVGVDILVVFLLLAGVILLTGASLAGVLRATGSGLIDTTRMMRALGDRRRAARDAPRADGSSVEDVAPSALRARPSRRPSELIVRATHVEAPSQDGPRASSRTPSADASDAAAERARGRRAGRGADEADARSSRGGGSSGRGPRRSRRR